MNAFTMIVNYLLTSVVAGVLGGAAMLGAMWLMTRSGLARGNMVVVTAAGPLSNLALAALCARLIG